MKHRVIAMLLCLTMLFGLISIHPITVKAENQSFQLMIETTDGTRKTIDFVNPLFKSNGGTLEYKNSISLFSAGNRPFVSEGTIKTNVAVVVDDQGKVTQVINQSIGGNKPSFSESTDVTVPEGGFVLLAYDDSYANAGFKSFLATKFQVGDFVKLFNGDVEITLQEALDQYQPPSTEDGNGTTPDFTYTLENLTVETAFDPNFGSTGDVKAIDFVNPDFSGPVAIKNSISLFTYGNRPFVSEGTIKTNVAVVVDKNMTVVQVINQSVNGAKPSFTESTDVVVPEGGFVLLAYDSSYADAGYKKFLATSFQAGDVIKLKVNDKVATVAEILQLTGQTGGVQKHANFMVAQEGMRTITESSFTISGMVSNMQEGVTYSVRVVQMNTGQEYVQEISTDGIYSVTVPVSEKTNYFDVTLVENGIDYVDSTKSVIVYQRTQDTTDKPVILWIDQYASAKNLNTTAKIEKMVANAKRAGVTAFVFDVKGCEGYVSYKNATRTNAPYLTETTNPNKVVSMEIDFLEEMIQAAHANGIKLYASMNFFTEGNIATNDSALDLANTHKDWAEVLQAPEDKGALMNVLDSARKSTLLFVNPGNPEVRAHEIDLVKEVLDNYSVDGIVLDRARYDNQYADFSELSRQQFEAYLNSKGKTLQNWPADAFTIQADGTMVTGQHYLEWLSYRSSVISSFVSELSTVIDQYEVAKNRKIDFAAYVGSWYEVYYQNGVNWADDSFVYNERLGFPVPELYAPENQYAQTSYIPFIDFIMTGCYYTTESQMQKYTTLSNILINEAVPVYASIDLTNLPEAPMQRTIFQAAYKDSDGSMIFDLCFVDWEKLRCAIADIEYKNSSVMGVYNPLTKEYLAIDNIDTARAEDKITIYTEGYGTSTGTNQWGVEVIVDATGKVTGLKNQMQAVDWNWATPELNDSTIPAGGFVLSTVDRSGSRVYRQLLANTFHVGDKVAAAVLSEFLEEENTVYTTSVANLDLKVQAFGQEKETVVMINGKEAVAGEENSYSAKVNLTDGMNKVPVSVFVDGLKVLEKELTLIASLTPVTPPVTPPVVSPSEEEDSKPTVPEKEEIKLEEVLEQVVVSPSNLKLYVGGDVGTEDQIAVVLPTSILKDDKKPVTVTYETSNKEVATVSDDGKVTGILPGNAVITTKITVDGITKEFNTSVIVKEASIKIVTNRSTVSVGTKITAHCIAQGYDVSKIQWGTTKRKIATVGKNSGLKKVNVTTQTVGKDVLYVYVMDGKEKVVLAEKEVTVTK